MMIMVQILKELTTATMIILMITLILFVIDSLDISTLLTYQLKTQSKDCSASTVLINSHLEKE